VTTKAKANSHQISFNSVRARTRSARRRYAP